jgi:hypothetical protein
MKGLSQLNIDEAMTIAEVETKFNALFPFLTIEFFKKGESVEGNCRLKPIKDIARKLVLNSFVILPNMTVHELEEKFWEQMGLQISVYRKVGNSILETSFTSNWTLEHQNTKGSELLFAFNTNIPDTP